MQCPDSVTCSGLSQLLEEELGSAGFLPALETPSVKSGRVLWGGQAIWSCPSSSPVISRLQASAALGH